MTINEQLPSRYQLVWNYFSMGHGKSKVNGISVLLKKELRKEQAKFQGLKIQNAKEMISFLQSEFSKFHAAHLNA
jgi:hypothetical protein